HDDTDYNEPFKISDIQSQNNTVNDKKSGEYYKDDDSSILETNNTINSFLKGSDNISTKYTTKTIEDSHIKQSDGTWKPKYKTYSPNRDNDAIPGNRIKYTEPQDIIIGIVAAFIVVLLYLLFMYRLIKTKKNATPKNLVNQYNDGQ